MSTFSKKVVSATLTATTAVWMSGVMLLVPAAHAAQTTVDLNAQIAALLAQIDQLKSQLGTPASATTFTRDLTVGSRGDDVKALQQVLIDKGYLAIAEPTTYFGSKTKAAVAAWQKDAGISPASGRFGPKSRAAMNAAVPPVTPPATPPVTPPATPPVTPPATPTSTSTPAAAGALTVAVSSKNPGAGSLISSAGSAASRVPVLALDLTAGPLSAATVTSVNFKKMGVLSDSSIGGAYLVENGKVVAQYNSISSGVISFSGLSWSVSAGQTKTLWLAIDPAAGLSAGNTVSFSLLSADAIASVDSAGKAITETGAFPLNGNMFTVTTVSNPSLATLTITSSSIGTTVTAGTPANIVGAWNFTVANSKLNLASINFKVIGSANKTDLKNVMLKVNGVQVGATLASVASDGSAFFDASATPGVLNTGSNNIQLFADVMGSPSYNFQFELLNSYDVNAVDSQYNVPVAAQSNVGTQVTINQGQMTITTATNTPTGNVARGQSGVTIAKFSIYAAGEAVKIKWLGVGFNLTGITTSTTNQIDNEFKNLAVIDDAGGQIGTTINTLSTTVTCTDTGFANSTSSYRNCFGNNSSPINYIVPANTTRVLSLKADIQSAATFSTVTGVLTGNTTNLQGLTSSATASSGGANGSALSLAASSLTIAKNTAVGTQNFAAGATQRKIGSYAFTASSAEGVQVNNLTVQTGAAGASFQNLTVKVGSTQFGNTVGVLGASTSYGFSGAPFTVAAGQTVYVDVYADILSSASAGTKTTITTLSGCSATGVTSYTSISCASTTGQDIAVTGQATIQVALDSSASPAATQIVMGTTGVSLAAFRITETTNVEDVKITDMIIFDQVSTTSSVKSGFGNVKLYKSSDLTNPISTAGSALPAASSSNPGSGYYYKFNFATPLIVPQANSVTIVLKGDVSSYSSSGASDNTTHVFKVTTSTDSDNSTLSQTVVALGSTSNASSTTSLVSATANTMTVLRSKLTVTGAALGATTGRSKSGTDDLGTITFAADTAGAISINTVTITFGGTAPSATAFLDGVQLYDLSTGSNMGTGNTTSSECDAKSAGNPTCSKTFKLGNTTAGYIVSAGGSKTFTIRANTLNTMAASTGVSQSMSVSVNASTDVYYTDGLDGAAISRASLPATVVPIQITSVSYVAGQ